MRAAILGFVLLLGPARFSVDGAVTTASTTVATIEPRSAAPGYSWLRVYFYSAPLPVADARQAAEGRIDAVKTRWSAVLQMTLDSAAHVWQIDLALPGHTCTIAESDREAARVLQDFQFDGQHVRMKAAGSHVCDVPSLGLPRQTFAWAVDIASPVVEAHASQTHTDARTHLPDARAVKRRPRDRATAPSPPGWSPPACSRC